MEFFYVVKATQKSGKEDAVIWFTAKSEARANLQLDVELEDAGIETGRGKDYAKPVRTDFPVYNDLPEENTVDYTWCKRYELQDDGRTWLPKAGDESTGPVDNSAAPETTVKVGTIVESVPLENRTPAVRYAIHLTSDKYQSHISHSQLCNTSLEESTREVTANDSLGLLQETVCLIRVRKVSRSTDHVRNLLCQNTEASS